MAEETTTTPAPEVPEKFRTEDGGVNTEALLKSYRELEARMSNPPKEEPAKEEPAKEEPAKPLASTFADARKVLTDKGLDAQALSEEIYSKGELSADSLKKLEAAGITPTQASATVEAIQAHNEQLFAKAVETVGGEENFKKMAEWAKAKDPQMAQMFNQVVDKGDIELVNLALQSLKSRYDTAMVAEPKMLENDGNGPGSRGGLPAFKNEAEYRMALKDGRYRSDPNFRSDVEARLRASMRAGIIR